MNLDDLVYKLCDYNPSSCVCKLACTKAGCGKIGNKAKEMFAFYKS
jgi:hypothetical protein